MGRIYFYFSLSVYESIFIHLHQTHRKTSTAQTKYKWETNVYVSKPLLRGMNKQSAKTIDLLLMYYFIQWTRESHQKNLWWCYYTRVSREREKRQRKRDSSLQSISWKGLASSHSELVNINASTNNITTTRAIHAYLITRHRKIPYE